QEPDFGRDIAPRCPRPRSSGRNCCAAAHGADGAARRPRRFRPPMRATKAVKTLPACLLAGMLGLSCLPAACQSVESLPQTQPLTWEGDLSARMVEGIDRFLMGELDRSVHERQKLWRRDFSSHEAYARSVQPNRERLQRDIGVVEARLRVQMLEYVSDTATLPVVAETEAYRVYAVRWPVFEDVYGEGLFLQPTGEVQARVIAIPDADQTPEMLVGLAP